MRSTGWRLCRILWNGTNRSCYFCSKNHILGFYDPCLGERKQLRIRYEFQERMHEVVVADMDHVALPIRCKFLVNIFRPSLAHFPCADHSSLSSYCQLIDCPIHPIALLFVILVVPERIYLCVESTWPLPAHYLFVMQQRERLAKCQ